MYTPQGSSLNVWKIAFHDSVTAGWCSQVMMTRPACSMAQHSTVQFAGCRSLSGTHAAGCRRAIERCIAIMQGVVKRHENHTLYDTLYGVQGLQGSTNCCIWALKAGRPLCRPGGFVARKCTLLPQLLNAIHWSDMQHIRGNRSPPYMLTYSVLWELLHVLELVGNGVPACGCLLPHNHYKPLHRVPQAAQQKQHGMQRRKRTSGTAYCTISVLPT